MRPLRRAQALLELGRPEEAAEEAARVLAIEPGEAAAWCVLSAARVRLNDPPGALAAADSAVAADPGAPHAWRLRACALLVLGRPEEAVLAAREGARLEPDAAGAQLLLAECLVRTEDGREEAHACAVRAVELAPADADTHHVRGVTAAALGRHQEAVRAQRTALRADPQHTLAQHALGRLRLVGGDLYGAAEAFAAAAAADPLSGAAPRQDLESTWLRLLGPFFVISLACAFLSIPLFHPDGSGLPVAARFTGAGLVVLVWAAYFGAAVLRIPRRLRPAAVSALRLSRAARVSVASVSACTVVALLLLAVPPLDGAVGGWLMAIAFVGQFVGAILASRLAHGRRDRGGGVPR